MTLLANQAIKWAKAGRHVIPFLNTMALCDNSEASLNEEKVKILFEKFPEANGIGLVTGVEKGIVAVLLNEQQQLFYHQKTGRKIFEDTVCFSIANKALAMFIPDKHMRASLCEKFFNGESCLVYKQDRSISRIGTNNVAAIFPEDVFIPEVEKFSIEESISQIRNSEEIAFVEIVSELFFFMGKNFLEEERQKIISACTFFSKERFDLFALLAEKAYLAGKDSENVVTSLYGGIKL